MVMALCLGLIRFRFAGSSISRRFLIRTDGCDPNPQFERAWVRSPPSSLILSVDLFFGGRGFRLFIFDGLRMNE